MDDDKKYTKLLTEYSKLRAQAKVLKNAVLEEKNKVSVLQESLRVKDQNLRRAETELDSVNFRNKQLEHRVQVIQDDLQKNNKSGNSKSKVRDNQTTGNGQIDPIIMEDYQKRIIENAQLASTVSDKNNEIEMYTNRIKDLELQLSKHMNEHAEVEKKLRKEVEVLTSRASDLETKVVEGTSQVGSEGDGVSLASDSTLPLHMTASADERIVFLEKELNHYRTQYELMKINEVLRADELLTTQQNQLQNNNNQRKVLSSQSSTSSSMSTNNNHSTFVNYPTSSHSSGSGSKSSPCQNSKSLPEPKGDEDHNEPPNRDQLVYEYFSKRFDELFYEKSKAESKVINFMTECESLKASVELLMEDLQEKDRALKESQNTYQRLEEDFVTTRVNYEEQICVLTDQVLHLSDQLASR